MLNNLLVAEMEKKILRGQVYQQKTNENTF